MDTEISLHTKNQTLIKMAKVAARSLYKTCTDSAITISRKKLIINMLIFPIALLDTKICRQKENRRLRWDEIGIEGVPRTLRRIKESILGDINEPQWLSQIVNALILKYFGYRSRRENNNLERLVVYGKMEETRMGSRFPRRWSDQIK